MNEANDIAALVHDTCENGPEHVNVTVDGRPVARIRRDGRLWRQHVVIRSEGRDDSLQSLAEAMAILHERHGPAVRVAIPLHEGYWAMYGKSGLPIARVLQTSDGWRFRRFEPHESAEVSGLAEAIDLAYAGCGA